LHVKEPNNTEEIFTSLSLQSVLITTLSNNLAELREKLYCVGFLSVLDFGYKLINDGFGYCRCNWSWTTTRQTVVELNPEVEVQPTGRLIDVTLQDWPVIELNKSPGLHAPEEAWKHDWPVVRLKLSPNVQPATSALAELELKPNK